MDDNERRRPAEMADDDEREAKRIRLDKAPMPTPSKTFDSKGDLYLVVGIRAGDPSTFLVCSKVLARASPVFDKMLFGPFAESRPSTESSKQDSAWIVHLPETNRPILRWYLELEDVYEAKLALHIAWHLGCISTFREALLVITEQSFISEDGHIFIFPKGFPNLNEDGEEIAAEPQGLEKYLGDLIPLEAVDQIKDHRAKVVIEIMNPFVTLHDDLANGQRRCSTPDDHDECDNMLLGSLIRSFRQTTLREPSKDAVQQYRGSVIDLEGNLDGVNLMTLRSHDRSSECYRDLQKRRMEMRKFDSIFKRSIAVVLLPQQIEHLQRQAVKSGWM
ncbi:hypothetical protein K4K56_004477 [Colletotrichum sp. SAR 10_98]|nr:hypothetical protein K4K56_004477 [Colletotrichum sp. SAR 10_98]